MNEKAMCPHCQKEIELNRIIKKFFGGKAEGKSLLDKIATSSVSVANVAYICPECNVIIGVGS